MILARFDHSAQAFRSDQIIWVRISYGPFYMAHNLWAINHDSWILDQKPSKMTKMVGSGPILRVKFEYERLKVR